MAQIYRNLGPGDHSMGEVVLTFDADGIAESEDPAVLEIVAQWPAIFALVEDMQDVTVGEEPPPVAPEGEEAVGGVLPASEGEDGSPASETASSAYTEDELEGLTVAELRELATTAAIPRAYSLNKAELVAALMAAREN